MYMCIIGSMDVCMYVFMNICIYANTHGTLIYYADNGLLPFVVYKFSLCFRYCSPKIVISPKPETT